MKAEMNEIERNGTRKTGRPPANHASTALGFSSSIARTLTFGPISTAC